jgi:hypothetical protein
LLVISLLIPAITNGQFESYVSRLQQNGDGINIAEITLVYHYPEPQDSNKVIARKEVIIPAIWAGEKLIIRYFRFQTLPGQAYLKNGHTFLPVILYYDNNTQMPDDDFRIAELPFEVPEDLLLNQRGSDNGYRISAKTFHNAPPGKNLYKPGSQNFSAPDSLLSGGYSKKEVRSFLMSQYPEESQIYGLLKDARRLNKIGTLFTVLGAGSLAVSALIYADAGDEFLGPVMSQLWLIGAGVTFFIGTSMFIVAEVKHSRAVRLYSGPY